MDNMFYTGQWQGFFCYGPEYGEIVSGCEVEFRMFVEEYNDGQFSGRVINWEGMGANGEVAKVNGFIDGHSISFIKEYPQLLQMDEWGNTFTDPSKRGHTVTYEGRYDPGKKCFYGDWEIVVVTETIGQSLLEHTSTGTWRMAHHT